MPNAKVLEKKKEEVKNLKEKMEKSKLIVLTDYRGINVEDITKIRADLRKTDCEYQVTKNTALRFAAKEANLEGLESYLEGPTAITFTYADSFEPAKVLYEYAKTSEFYKIKAGVMDGKVISAEEVIKIAKLPSKNTLLAGLATALLGNIRNLAVVLNQVKEKQEVKA